MFLNHLIFKDLPPKTTISPFGDEVSMQSDLYIIGECELIIEKCVYYDFSCLMSEF